MPPQKLIRERQCAYCGKTFQLTPVGYFKGQKCCSPECANQLRKGVPNLKNSKPKIAKICLVCGKEFFVQPAQSHIICCSTTCAGIRQSNERKGEKAANWKGGKVEAVCEFCGKTYQIFRYRDDETHYCSHSCASRAINKGEKSYRWKGGPQKKICEFCGQEFIAPSINLKQRFCSRECHDLVRTKRVQLVCTNCGKQFSEKPSKANRYIHAFCCHECYAEYARGENSHLWEGGKSFEPYPPTFDDRFKRMIRERDKHTCALCGSYGDNVHHRNRIKEDTIPENCITLCRACHTRLHRSKLP